MKHFTCPNYLTRYLTLPTSTLPYGVRYLRKHLMISSILILHLASGSTFGIRPLPNLLCEMITRRDGKEKLRAGIYMLQHHVAHSSQARRLLQRASEVGLVRDEPLLDPGNGLHRADISNVRTRPVPHAFHQNRTVRVSKGCCALTIEGSTCGITYCSQSLANTGARWRAYGFALVNPNHNLGGQTVNRPGKYA